MVMEGLVDEIYPDGRFGVMLDNEHRIIAYTADAAFPHQIGGRRPRACQILVLTTFIRSSILV